MFAPFARNATGVEMEFMGDAARGEQVSVAVLVALGFAISGGNRRTMALEESRKSLT